MKANKTVFELLDIFSNFTIIETIKILNSVKEARQELFEVFEILKLSCDELHNYSEMQLFREQIRFADNNIKVLEEAIMCHETKIIEKRTLESGVVITFGLN